MTDVMITPADLAARFLKLDGALEDATARLKFLEQDYPVVKDAYIAVMASARIKIRQKRIEQAVKYTIAEIEDEATMESRDTATRLSATEGLMRATRMDVEKVQTQVSMAQTLAKLLLAQIQGGL